MKARDLILMLLIAVASVAVSGCNKQEPQGMDLPPLGIRESSNYAFDIMLYPRSLLVRSIEPGKFNSSERSMLSVSFKGEIYDATQDQSVAHELLKDFRSRVGDVYRPSHYTLPNMPHTTSALGKGIVSISIEAVEDYNANYPAGSSLAPIAEISYSSFDVDFAHLLTVQQPGLYPKRMEYKRLLSEGLLDMKIPSTLDMNISLKQAPSKSKVKLLIAIRFVNNTTIQQIEEVEILEAK